MFTIWDEDFNLEDWEDYFTEIYDEEELEDMDDEVKWEIVNEMNYNYLEDERANLSSIKLEGRIIALADLGLWNGRRSGYQVMGYNLADCLYSFTNSMSYMKFFVEDGEFRAREIHHDGTNYYTFRMLKPEVDEYDFDFCEDDVDQFSVPLGKVILDFYGATE